MAAAVPLNIFNLIRVTIEALFQSEFISFPVPKEKCSSVIDSN